MNELIKITDRQIGEGQVQTINARELHAFLEIKTAFKDWIARRVDEYDFKEGKDFCSILSESSGGRPTKEYALTLEMAKELSMVERNEKGKQARQYFLECEKRAKRGIDPIVVLNDPAAMRGLLLTYSERVMALEVQLNEASPKLEALDRIATANGSLCVTEAAKALQIQPKKLFDWLQHHHWIYRRPGGQCWLGYQERVQPGLLEHKVTTVSRPDGTDKIIEQVRITPKGITKIAKDLNMKMN